MTEAAAPLRIFIGFDPRQCVAYTALSTSIIAKSTKPVAITPLIIQNLPMSRTGLTDFTYSRFIVPWLCNFSGYALFLDADTLFKADPAELFAVAEGDWPGFSPAPAVWVREDPDGNDFERAAIMLFNCSHPDNRKLTPEYVDDPEACKTPHLIDWTEAIGTLPTEWGHLVGYNKPDPAAKLIHYTQGIPAFPQTWECEHGEEWQRHLAISILPLQAPQLEVGEDVWEQIMGNSVHAKTVTDADGKEMRVPKLWEPPKSGPQYWEE